MAMTGFRVVDLVKNIVSKAVSEGDIAVDATAGNGYDTLFLADLVGDTGMVYAFDIQQQAIDTTRERLKAKGFDKRVRLILDGHQNMDRYINKGIKAVVFNLGYLPGDCHDITTKFYTTLAAVNKSLGLLLPGGIVTIAAYRGHGEGYEEDIALYDFLSDLDPSHHMVIRTQAINQRNNPPVLYCVQKP